MVTSRDCAQALAHSENRIERPKRVFSTTKRRMFDAPTRKCRESAAYGTLFDFAANLNSYESKDGTNESGTSPHVTIVNVENSVKETKGPVQNCAQYPLSNTRPESEERRPIAPC